MSSARPHLRLLAPLMLQAVPAIMMSVIIIGGIRFGVVTATEAGVVAVVYALMICIVFYRSIGLRRLWEGLKEASIGSGMVGFMLGVAAPFAWVMISGRLPQHFVEIVFTYVQQDWAILLVLNIIMLIAGTFLDLTAVLLIVAPLALPLVISMGVDPVHFGIICVFNLMLGPLPPPYGILVFITSAVTGTEVQKTFRAVVPFFLSLLLGLALVTMFPAISMGLVAAIF